MKQFPVLILTGIICVLLIVSGCTSTAPTTPATPVATTATPVESLTKTTVTYLPATETPSWSGTWNSTWLEQDGNLTVAHMTLTQVGPVVSGNYSYSYPKEGTFTGSLNATVQGNTVSGTYSETDNDTGLFIFTLSENKNSFTGRGVHTVNMSELDQSTLSWNGVRK
ncbi:MAG: hypothetical protein Q8R70_06970 [Methanoregula sp.]|nr:hypothetical protein [Methanoregula sp.]